MATQQSAPSTLPSDNEEVLELAEEQPAPCFPPYPPVPDPVPPSIAESIGHGRKLRLRDPPPPRPLIHVPPQPAKPWTPRATDIKMSKQVRRAHIRCLKHHGTVLTERLAQLARPRPRTVIYLWREFAHTLPPETIVRLRSMLDADQPFKPDQAYEYFQNLRKIQKKNAKVRSRTEKSKEICGTPWQRSATVAFARAVKEGLSHLGTYDLDEGLLRLSNVILNDLCRIMKILTPPCLCCGKAKNCYMKEIADEIAVWISMIMDEANERMLMMDADEDDGKDIDTDSNEEVKLLDPKMGRGDGGDQGEGDDGGTGGRTAGLGDEDEDEGEMGPPSVGTEPDDDGLKQSVCCEKITQAERNQREEERHKRLCTYIGTHTHSL
ncbi:hypothetical protein EVAR_59958_1 [Eumeta japonica]|uniref:Uncharacterized protein n=1 Tax=Eumeta variegata TaxID=151549 RepID=A0A4C1YSL7_EUMVA|nr:hypothetical protein EVAR_59958_1 [Eumeta japonica]